MKRNITFFRTKIHIFSVRQLAYQQSKQISDQDMVFSSSHKSINQFEIITSQDGILLWKEATGRLIGY